MSLRIVMMATGEFALPALKGLYETEHQIVGLYTQPDKTGRGHHMHVNALKEYALQKGTDVFQPKNVNQPDALKSLHTLKADLFVVAAYGQILSAELLDIPPLGAINIHASILPRHRGAAPIHYAIMKGDQETGVTIFQIEPKVDAGLILGIIKTNIAHDETTGILHDRLAKLAVPLLKNAIEKIEKGTTTGITQDPTLVTLSPKMTKAFGQINWNQPATDIVNHIRAMQPWPTAFTFLYRPNQQPLRVIIASARNVLTSQQPTIEAKPGQTIPSEDHTLIVQTTLGTIAIQRLRPAGKREMTAEQFLNGYNINHECYFGNVD